MNSKLLISRLPIIIGFVLLSVILWLKVDLLPIQLWDEGRNAVNAIEMDYSQEYIVRTYDYQPETYNLKPPLLTWMQVVAFKLFGHTETAIRLPSVLASFGTLILVYLIVVKLTSRRSTGFLAAAITVTSYGFYGEHVGRYGDHDALLIFFCMLLMHQLICFINDSNSKRLYFMATAIALGVLTKSITILIFLPGLLAMLLLSGKLFVTIRNRHTYGAMALALIPIVGYYLLREQAQPGFLDYVWNDELFPRYMNTSANFEYHEEPWWYYLQLIYRRHFVLWVYLTPLILVPLIALRKQKAYFSYVGLVITAFWFLFVISKGSKNFWYDAPLIPLLAILVAVGVDRTVTLFTDNKWVPPMIALLLIAVPYSRAYNAVLHTQEKYYNWEAYGISYYLRDDDRAKHLTSNHRILLDSVYGFEPHKFYVERMKIEQDIELQRVWLHQTRVNDTLLIAHRETQAALEQRYSLEILDSFNTFSKRVVLHEPDIRTNLD